MRSLCQPCLWFSLQLRALRRPSLLNNQFLVSGSHFLQKDSMRSYLQRSPSPTNAYFLRLILCHSLQIIVAKLVAFHVFKQAQAWTLTKQCTQEKFMMMVRTKSAYSRWAEPEVRHIHSFICHKPIIASRVMPILIRSPASIVKQDPPFIIIITKRNSQKH